MIPKVHILTGLKDTVYTVGCGLSFKAKSCPEEVTYWSYDITCPLCATRVFVLHRRLESMVEMGKLIDLDDPEQVYRFHFEGKRFGFRWLMPTPLIYIYNNVDDKECMQAISVQGQVGPLTDTPVTREMVTARAKEWIIDCGKRFNDDGSMRSTTVRKPPRPKEPPKPVVPPGYTGPLCAGCGKIDEGDFMPNPKNMMEEVCMSCLVAQSR